MKLKKSFIFIVLFFAIVFAGDKFTDPWNDFNHILSSSDSVYVTSGITYLKGIDTYDIIIPTLESEGLIGLWGTITTTTGAGVDTVFFWASPYRGDGDTHYSGYTYSWQAVDTCALTALGTNSFDFMPVANDVIADSYSDAIVIRVFGKDNHTRKINYMQIERNRGK